MLLSRLRRALPPISLLMLTVAGIVNAFGVVLFLSPVALYDSGISGTSMLFAQLARGAVPFSLFLIVLNVPLFLYGLRREGSTFTIRYGGALDGIEVLAVIFSRRLGMTVGTFVMTYNALLYVVAGVIMGSWVLPLYSIVTYAIGIKAVDFIVEGLDKTKAAMIITDHPQDICRELSAAFGTGITLIDAHGYYSGDSKTMIYFVVNRFQIARMRTIVHDIDDKAFISITEVSDLFGKNAK